MESIKNRYPCKIIDTVNLCDFSQETKITFLAATKTNIRTCSVKNIIDDPLLVEKFHPTEAVKLGFIAFSEIILKEGISIEEARDLYSKIIRSMFDQ